MAARTSELVVTGPNEEGDYEVQSGPNRYLVDPRTGECTCGHYRFRCRFSETELCKHFRRVREHIEGAMACPACRGAGFIQPVGLIRYVKRDGTPDDGPWECLICNATGKRTENW